MMTGYELEIGKNKNPESDDIAVRYVDDGECAALFLSDGSYTDNRRATELAQELINVHNAKLKIGERKIEMIDKWRIVLTDENDVDYDLGVDLSDDLTQRIDEIIEVEHDVTWKETD